MSLLNKGLLSRKPHPVSLMFPGNAGGPVPGGIVNTAGQAIGLLLALTKAS